MQQHLSESSRVRLLLCELIRPQRVVIAMLRDIPRGFEFRFVSPASRWTEPSLVKLTEPKAEPDIQTFRQP